MRYVLDVLDVLYKFDYHAAMVTPSRDERNDQAVVRARMRDGAMQQITEHIDRIERELSEVQELVTRMREDNAELASIRGAQLARDRGVTSSCWPDESVRVQEDSASL
jgi:predicted transcriptional regulator